MTNQPFSLCSSVTDVCSVALQASPVKQLRILGLACLTFFGSTDAMDSKIFLLKARYSEGAPLNTSSRN